MRWAVVVGCLAAGVAWGAGVGQEPEAAPAKADVHAHADAHADADADENGVGVREIGVRMVGVGGDIDVFVIDGDDGQVARTVFLTGSCTDPRDYIEKFQKAAASHGGLVALQGDVVCRDGSRRWSADTQGLAARIQAALHAAGAGAAGEPVTVVGYSQGAERAEWLAQHFRADYTRFVLMAGPIVPSAGRFAGAHGVALLAGYGDVRENMADGARVLRRSSIRAIYMELPGSGHHGELEPAVDGVVAQAFDWLDTNATVAKPHGRGARANHPHTH